MVNNNIVIATFYKFVKLDDFKALQKPILEVCQQNNVYGIILLAQEGINSTIAGTRDGIDAVLNYLRADARFADMTHKESFTDMIPFRKMRVRLKKEIVTLKQAVDPTDVVGTYVSADQWNDLISDPDVLVIDTRNTYEYDIGTFKRAVNPETDSFHEFTDYVEKNLDPTTHKKVAMFCTGGIRCEKATSYMLQQGFEEVYHLKDGILKYLEVVDPQESLWEGECFVFDYRVSVDHHLQPGEARICGNCGEVVVNQVDACGHCGKTAADGVPEVYQRMYAEGDDPEAIFRHATQINSLDRVQGITIIRALYGLSLHDATAIAKQVEARV